MYLLTACFPILSIFLLMVLLRMSAMWAMAVGAIGTFLLGILVWQIPLRYVLAASLEGWVIALSIVSIVFGAMLLLFWQQQSGNLRVMITALQRLSPDPRLQVLWLSWFAVAFLEGIAGFGTPAAIIAPILLSLGVAPLAAAALPLIADSSAVSFGAIGTPVLIGIAQGAPQLSTEQLREVYLFAAQLDWLAAPILPLLIMAIYCRWFSPTRSWAAFRDVLPLTLVAGFSYSTALLFSAWWLGPEFPSMIAAMFGFSLSYAASTCAWFRPAPMTSISLNVAEPLPTQAEHAGVEPTSQGVLWALLPYAVLIVLLLLSRLPQLPLKGFLQQFQLQFPNLLDTDISTSVAPFYLPSSLFILTLIVLVPFYHKGGSLFWQSSKLAMARLKTSLVTLMFAVPMVRIFVQSGTNDLQLPAMPSFLANTAIVAVGEYWVWGAAWLGALGSFIAGSATFSNLMFSGLQFDIAKDTGLSEVGLLALQMLGANAGNMICIVNIVAVVSVMQKNGIESHVLRLTLLPMVLYLSLVTCLGWWFLR